jgi:hypothetical protein
MVTAPKGFAIATKQLFQEFAFGYGLARTIAFQCAEDREPD